LLGTILDNILHWKQHTHKQIMELNTACDAIRTLKHVVPHCLGFIFLISTLLYLMALFSVGQLTVKYRHFQIKKRRVITGSINKDSCRIILETSIV
jgi:hypothetical protein